jgi:peroxiredoxin
VLANIGIRTALGALLLMILSAWANAAVTQEPAPAFSLPDRTGRTVSLDEFKGQVVLINFWASWCGPCRQEMPLLEELHQRYASLGFTLLGINVEEDSALADNFLQSMPVNFPILFDQTNSVSKAYDVIAMPTTVILDREGLVRFVHYGYEAGYENDYQDQVRTLIRE